MKGKQKNVLFIIPRYLSYGMSNHYVIPMGIMYVSSFVKKSEVANVFTVNLNHEIGTEEEVLARVIQTNHIDVAGLLLYTETTDQNKTRRHKNEQ